MNDQNGSADEQRSHEGDAALLHGEHEDGHHEHGREDGLHDEARSDANTGAERVLGLELPWDDSGDDGGGSDRAEELRRDDTYQADPVEGASEPEADGYLSLLSGLCL